MSTLINRLLLLSLSSILSGCLSDYLPPNPKQEQEILIQEAIAAGSGCRQVGRSLENCYERNERLPKSGILTGWREMDDYMRTNKMQSQEIVEPAVYGKNELKNKETSDGLQQSNAPASVAVGGTNSGQKEASAVLGASTNGATNTVNNSSGASVAAKPSDKK